MKLNVLAFLSLWEGTSSVEFRVVIPEGVPYWKKIPVSDGRALALCIITACPV